MHETRPDGSIKATLAAMDPQLADELRSALDRAAELTAVDRFSQWHQGAGAAALESSYRALLPATAPGPGEQYAFEVDLDKCSGCKACVAACHSQNGLDESESWRVAGTLVGRDAPARVTVTSSCHHCAEPGCATGCPTLAYEKDPATGIVHHLDDQCMGCQYCTWTCPYDAPKWSDRLGIVRKCDMCRGRLAAGEAPACAQSCPHQAIRIVVVPRGEEAGGRHDGMRLPGVSAPDSTGPSTRYVGEIPGDAVPEDAHDPLPEHGHAPLAALLVLTQWATGLWLLAEAASLLGGSPPLAARPLAAALLLAGLGIGALHLGRPERAWKAFLGWRRSWFSREVLAFGNAVPLVLVASVPAAFAPTAILPYLAPVAPAALAFLLAGVVCSTMIYVATPRPAWSRPATGWRFGLTVLGGGAVLLGALGGEGTRVLGALSVATGLAKALLVLRDRKPRAHAHPSLALQARLLAGPLRGPAVLQLRLFLVAVGCAAVATATGGSAWLSAAVGFRLACDLVERVLFFRACPGTRMPGGAGRDR